MDGGDAKRVLVIDDDAFVRKVVARALENAGCRVVGQAGDGSEGLRLYKETQPDLTLLDIMMPGRDGLATLRAIRTLDGDAHVVMLTSVADTAVAENCIVAGARDYINKDAGAEALAARIRRVVSGDG